MITTVKKWKICVKICKESETYHYAATNQHHINDDAISITIHADPLKAATVS